MPSATSPSFFAESCGTHCPTRPSTVALFDATCASSSEAAEPDDEPGDEVGEGVVDDPVSEDATAGTGTPTVTVGVTTGVGAAAPKIIAGRAASTPSATRATATTFERPATIQGRGERAGVVAAGWTATIGGGTTWFATGPGCT